MVDPDSESTSKALNFFELEKDEDASQNVSLRGDVETFTTDILRCSCKRCVNFFGTTEEKSKFTGYSKINPRAAEGLTEHQYFLCHWAVMAFVFRIRRWSRSWCLNMRTKT
jgi:hypothetical protein